MYYLHHLAAFSFVCICVARRSEIINCINDKEHKKTVAKNEQRQEKTNAPLDKRTSSGCFNQKLTDWHIYRTMKSLANMLAANSNVVQPVVLLHNSKHLFVRHFAGQLAG